MPFSQFVTTTLNNNMLRARNYTANTDLVYATHDGRTITFRPFHSPEEWGIKDITQDPALRNIALSTIGTWRKGTLSMRMERDVL